LSDCDFRESITHSLLRTHSLRLETWAVLPTAVSLQARQFPLFRGGERAPRDVNGVVSHSLRFRNPVYFGTVISITVADSVTC
jgi:hypothetical protein